MASYTFHSCMQCSIFSQFCMTSSVHADLYKASLRVLLLAGYYRFISLPSVGVVWSMSKFRT